MKFFKILLAVFLVGIGVVIGIAIRHYYDIPMSETINIIDVATLVTTIFLAVYIPEVLDRQMQVKRDKKDLIEKRVDELQALYRKINMLVQQESTSQKDNIAIRNTLDVTISRLDTIITLLTFSKMNTSFEKEIKEIKQLCQDHHDLLWSERFEEETFKYADDVQIREEVLYNKIDKETCLLVFKISEA